MVESDSICWQEASHKGSIIIIFRSFNIIHNMQLMKRSERSEIMLPLTILFRSILLLNLIQMWSISEYDLSVTRVGRVISGKHKAVAIITFEQNSLAIIIVPKPVNLTLTVP